MAFYDYDRKLLAAERKIKDATYSESNKKLILRFESSLFAEGLSKARVLKYLSQMHMIAGMCDFEFDAASKDDIEFIVGNIARSDRADWTKHGYMVAIKRFFRWLNGGDDPEITKWIHPKVKNPSKLPEELLSEEEVKGMITAAENIRDKALIALFWDAGGRTGELGKLKIKHVSFDSYGAVATVDGKTGMRRVRLIFSVPYIASWLDVHPQGDNPDAYLWVGIGQRGRGEPLSYASIRMIIKRTATKAGIKKRVYNHLFRHSRSTNLAQHLTESQLKEHLGWAKDSKMAAVYVHLSGKQIDEALLKIHGIVREEEVRPELTTVVCPRCDRKNSSVSNFCAKCGMALDMKTAANVEEKRSEIAMKLMELIGDEPEILKMLNSD